MADKKEENKENRKQERKATPYFDNYKQRYESHLVKKRGERQKQEQEGEGIIQKAGEEINAVEQKVLTEEQKIIEDVRKKLGESTNYLKEPKHIRIIKILAIIAVLAIIGYILASNFIISQDFNYFYDIGSQQDAKSPYLTPLNRISEIINDSNLNYRNLTSQLVYFIAPIPRGSENINVTAKFKDNFPLNAVMSIGASDNMTFWNYKYNLIRDKSNSTNNWLISSTTFNINQDSLAVKNSQLSLLFNVPHLGKNQTMNYTIPIDWINITVHKSGLFEKWREVK